MARFGWRVTPPDEQGGSNFVPGLPATFTSPRSATDVTHRYIEAELRMGLPRFSPSKTLQRIESFLSPIARIEFTSADAIAYGVVRSKLERAGSPIGPLDTLIASQATAPKLTLVTNNEREFRRVAWLTIENWSR